MKAVIGLGNPGARYETTRHNVGFILVDQLAERWHAQAWSKSFDGKLAQVSVGGEKILLVQPQTFMNRSGLCVGPLTQFYKIDPADLIVIHDDLDLDIGDLRIKVGGGTGGHNGLKSIDSVLGTGRTGYVRLRLGIGHPRRLQSRQDVADYVLDPFTDEELRLVEPKLEDAAAAIETAIKQGVSAAMNQFNTSNQNTKAEV